MANPNDLPAPSPLGQIKEEDLVGDNMDEETKKRKDLEKTLWTRLAEGLAIASAVLAVLAIIFSGASGVTIVAGLIAVGVAGTVIYQQELLQDTDSEFLKTTSLDPDCNPGAVKCDSTPVANASFPRQLYERFRMKSERK